VLNSVSKRSKNLATHIWRHVKIVGKGLAVCWEPFFLHASLVSGNSPTGDASLGAATRQAICEEGVRFEENVEPKRKSFAASLIEI
jgi:hypothetical protein